MLQNNFIDEIEKDKYNKLLENNYIKDNIIDYLNSSIKSINIIANNLIVIRFKLTNQELNYWIMLDIIYKFYKDQIIIEKIKNEFILIKNFK